MTKLNRTHLFWAKVWLCAGVGASAAAGIYAALIHPSILLVARNEEAERERKSAEQDYRRAISALESIQTRIQEKTERLEALGGSPPPENREDLIVTKLTNLAVTDGITVEQYIPLDTLEAEHHRAFFVQFKAHGEFTDLYRYLKRIESQVDFVDITHLSISRGLQRDDTTCAIEWSCRINTQRLNTANGPRDAMEGAVAYQNPSGEGSHAP